MPNSTETIPLQAISICQPYAELIASGRKHIENRTWLTRHPGPLVIHAAKSRNPRLREAAEEYNVDLHACDFGAIIAVARRMRCVTLRELQDELGTTRIPHAFGPYCWVLSDVVRLPSPIAIAGKLSLWNVPESIARRIARSIE